MKAVILDRESLAAVTPAALRAYILFEGWTRIEQFGDYSEIYSKHADQSHFEIAVPFTTSIADYAAAVSTIIRTLARQEGRDELMIYTDLSQADRDVVRVRASEADRDGSIGVEQGLELVHHARDILASAACAAKEPRRAYHLGKIQQTEEYMRRVRLGQTEHGSYVVTLLAPVPPALADDGQLKLWPSIASEPFERQVTRVLSQALKSARAAIVESNRGRGFAAFTSAVAQGVSANLCEAIAALVDQTEQIDFSVTWARTRPAPIARERAVFNRADSEILREAARQFRLREPRNDERIIGYVRVLKRAEDEFDGRVQIHAPIDGTMRSLSASLSEADYAVASDANVRQLPVTLIGDIEMEGQRWHLSRVRDIRIVEDTSEENNP
jgi:hypothetical protein